MKNYILGLLLNVFFLFFVSISLYAQPQTSRNVVSSGVSTGGSIQAGTSYLFGTNLYSTGSNASQIGLGNLCCDAINAPTIVSRNVIDFGLATEGGYYITQTGDFYGFGSSTNGRFDGEYLRNPTLLETGVTKAAMATGNYIFMKSDNSAWVNGVSTSSSRAKEIARNVREVGGTNREGATHIWYMYYLTSGDSLYGFSNQHNEYGTFGYSQTDGTQSGSYPVYIAENVKDFSVYSSQLVYVTKDGKLLGLGENEANQLGDGVKDPDFTGNRVANGDFSAGIIDPAFTFESNSGATISREIVDGELKVSLSAQQSGTQNAIIKLKLNKASIRYQNNGYTFSAKLRSDSNSDIRIKITNNTSNGNVQSEWRNQSVQVGPTEQTVELYFATWTDINAWFDTEAFVQFEIGRLSSPIYIDDISIVPTFSYDGEGKVFEPTLIDTDVVSARTGHELTMYQKSDGNFYVVGTDNIGMITGTKGTFETPTKITFPSEINQSEIIDYEVGYEFLVVALSDGSFYGVGNNSGGRIGLGRLVRTTKEWTKIKVPTYAGPKWFVDAENGDDEDGNGSEEAPYATIQYAIDQSLDYNGNEFDTVFVLPGVYEETIEISNKVIKMISASGPLETTIIGQSNQGLNIWGYSNHDYACDLLIEGFSITTDEVWVAVNINNACPTFSKAIISNPDRRGIQANNSAPKFENSIIYNSNEGLYIQGLEQSGNFSDYNLTLKHVAIINNNNRGIENNDGEIVQLINSIVYNNGRGDWQFSKEDVLDYQIRGDYEVTTSVVEGDKDAFNVNPLFKSDFSLSDFSALIGEGTETSITSDLAGNLRPNPAGSKPDIGPYENPLGDVAKIPQPDTISVNKTESSVTLTWKFSDQNRSSLNSILDKYVVFKAVGNIAEDLVAVDTILAPRSRFSDTDVEIGIPYIYAIQTITSDGRKSSIEDTRTVLVENLPPAAPLLSAIVNNTSVELSWEADDESIVGFELFRSTDETQLSLYKEIHKDSSSYLDEGLITGLSYYYALRAIDDQDDYSAFSDTLEAIPGSQLNQEEYLQELSTTTNYRNTEEYDHHTVFVVDGALYGAGKNNSQAFGLSQGWDNLYFEPERLDRGIIHAVATQSATIRINSQNELYAAGQMWPQLDNHYTEKPTLFRGGVVNADLSNTNLAYIDEEGNGYLTGNFPGRQAQSVRTSFLFAENVVDVELTNSRPSQGNQQNLYYLTKNGRLYGAGHNRASFIEADMPNYLKYPKPSQGLENGTWLFSGNLSNQASLDVEQDTFVVSYALNSNNWNDVKLTYQFTDEERAIIKPEREYIISFKAKSPVRRNVQFGLGNNLNKGFTFEELVKEDLTEISRSGGLWGVNSMEEINLFILFGNSVATGANETRIEISDIKLTDKLNGTEVPINAAGLIATNVKKMAAEYDHLLYITNGDSLFVIGDNEHSQLGDKSVLGATITTPKFIAKNVHDVRTSERYSHIITNQGLLFSTGDFLNNWAPYTFERIEDARVDTSVASDSTNNAIYVIEAPGAVFMADSVKESVPGLYYALYKKSDGNVYGIGNNLYGQLGIGSDDAYADKWTPIGASRYVGPLWYVDAKLGDNAGEGSISSPFKSIAMGVNVATNGDTILVLPGTYTERVDIPGKEITIMSTEGFEKTIVRPTEWSSFQLWNIGTKKVVIDGFTITNREEWCSATGINMWQSGLTLKNSKLVNLWEPLRMDQSVVTVENTIFTNNCNYPIWIRGINSQRIFTERKNILNHVTIVNNQNGIFLEEGYDVEITNSIIHSNGDLNNADFQNLSVQLSGEFIVKNSIVENWTEGENVYDFDPILRDDFSLPDFSLAIGKGTRTNVGRDIKGNSRPSGIVEPIFFPDLGARENPLHEPSNYPAPDSIKIIDREFYVDVEFQIDTVLVDYVNYFLIYRGVDPEEMVLIDTLFADENQENQFAKSTYRNLNKKGKALIGVPNLIYPGNQMMDIPQTEFLEWEAVEGVDGYELFFSGPSCLDCSFFFEENLVQPFGGFDENFNPIGFLGQALGEGNRYEWAVRSFVYEETISENETTVTLEYSDWSDLWSYTTAFGEDFGNNTEEDQPNKFTYSDLTAEIGIKYYYQIQMVGLDGRQGEKPEELPTVTIQNLPPKALKIQETSTFNGRATFGWAEPEDRDLAEFQIYRGTSLDELSRLTKVSADERQFRNTNLENGTTYYFAVTGIDNFGLEGPFSNVVGLTPQNLPPIVRDGSVRNLYQRGVQDKSTNMNFEASNYVFDVDGSIARIEWYDDNELALSYGGDRINESIQVEVEQGTNRIRLVATDNDSAKTTVEFNVNVSGAFRQLDQPLSDNSGITLIGSDFFFVPVVGGELKILNSQFNDRGLSVSVSGEIKSESSISTDTVMYIASTNRDINVFSKRGAPLWSTPLGGDLFATPTIDPIRNRVYVGVSNGNLFALNRDNGAVVWTFLLDSPVNDPPVVFKDNYLIVFTVTGQGYFFNLDGNINDGELRPIAQLGTQSGIKSAPAVDKDGFVYVAQEGGQVAKLYLNIENPSESQVIWQNQYSSSFQTTPVIGYDGTIFVGGLDSTLYAIDHTDGFTKWRFKTDGAITTTATINQFGSIYFGDETGKIYAIDEFGDEIYTYSYTSDQDDEAIISIGNATAYIDGNFVFATADGTLNKINDLWRYEAQAKMVNSVVVDKSPQWGTYQGNFRRSGNQADQMVTSNEIVDGLPTEFELRQNYPNPFNPSTTIMFALPQASHVKLEVFNVIGQRVAVIANSVMKAGYHQLQFDASALSSGTYFYKLTAGEFKQSKSMVLIK